MTNIAPDTVVSCFGSVWQDLRFTPEPDGVMVIVAHPRSLTPQNPSTQVMQIKDGDLLWVGTVDEAMVTSTTVARMENARSVLSGHLLKGANLWSVLAPGPLLRAGSIHQSSVYKDPHMWVVLGETTDLLLAATLSTWKERFRPDGRPKGEPVYHVRIAQAELPATVVSPRDSVVELNHLWSFPKQVSTIGSIAASAHERLREKVRRYYPVSP